MKAHAVIDPLWKSGSIKRKKVYSMLNKYFGGRKIHIGSSDIELCNRIIAEAPSIFL